MFQALQRRLARLFPYAHETLWLDMRQTTSPVTSSALVAIIGLDFLAAPKMANPVAGKALLLDMDDGACIEDVIRSGADGLLCSIRLPEQRRTLLAAQARTWNYPCVFDCRHLDASQLLNIRRQGFNAALFDSEQVQPKLFSHYTTNLQDG